MFDSNSIPDQIFSHLVKLPILKLQPNFGLLFDIDGVLGRGAVPLPQAQEAFRLLCDPDCKELRVPVAFVTNACVDGAAKSKMLSSWFKVPVRDHPNNVTQSGLSCFPRCSVYVLKNACFFESFF